MAEIVSVGECMIELAGRPDGAFDLRVGGDTFNTAIYLARLGAPVAYLTALGDDPYSGLILAKAHEEGVACDAVVIVSERMPGLYLIQTTAGERSFWYWRDTSPARELFELPCRADLAQRMRRAEVIYLSMITLSLYSPTGLDNLEEALIAARKSGARVAIDSNFRPAGWRGDRARAQSVYTRFLHHTDMALPSFDDEQALWGNCEPAQILERYRRFGISEICLKLGAQGALVASSAAETLVPPVAAVTPVDTTAAGDSFAAAYLMARREGLTPERAAASGNALAAIVIQHPGAIVPGSATKRFQLPS